LFSQRAQRTRDIIESKYSDGKLRPYCNDVIYFGMLKGSIGYLASWDLTGMQRTVASSKGRLAWRPR
jgi:hypothetical protein